MLDAQDLAARRGTTQLFSGLQFSLAPGHAMVVGGPNGSGKTTLLRILAGLCVPERGTLRWRNEPLRPFDPALRADVAFSGHATALKDELTARENLEVMVTLAGVEVSEHDLDAALESVALARQRFLPARVLSQGQRRRIGLARLRLVDRPLWILDEPVTALDRDGASMLDQLLERHLAGGGLAVIATHAPLGLAPARVQEITLQ